MDIVCPVDERCSGEISALLEPLPPHQIPEYYDERLLASRNCSGIHVREDGEFGKGVSAQEAFAEGELIFRDRMLFGCQHSSNKMLLGTRVIHCFSLGGSQKHLVGLLLTNLHNMLMKQMIFPFLLPRWWECKALPEDVDSSDEAAFRMQIKELAFQDRDGQATILEPIRIGEEITISYVYEDLPFEERQAALADYGFTCRCSKCREDVQNAGKSVERMSSQKDIGLPWITHYTLNFLRLKWSNW